MVPCPACGGIRGFVKVSEFRSQCKDCNSLIQNDLLQEDVPNQEQTNETDSNSDQQDDRAPESTGE